LLSTPTPAHITCPRGLRAVPPRRSSDRFGSADIPALLQQLGTTPDGLSTAEARARLETFGANRIAPPERTGDLRLLLSQFESPRSEEHTAELQSREKLVCRLLLEKKKGS